MYANWIPKIVRIIIVFSMYVGMLRLPLFIIHHNRLCLFEDG